MKKSAAVFVLMQSLALFLLGIQGCEKFQDNFPSGPTASQPAADPMPAGLVGTWTSKYAVVNGQQVTVREYYDDYLGRNIGTIKLQFSSNGDFSQYVLDPNDSTLWYLQGNSVFQGDYITLTTTIYNGERSPGGKIIEAWSLDGNQLVLMDSPPPTVASTSIIYSRE